MSFKPLDCFCCTSEYSITIYVSLWIHCATLSADMSTIRYFGSLGTTKTTLWIWKDAVLLVFALTNQRICTCFLYIPKKKQEGLKTAKPMLTVTKENNLERLQFSQSPFIWAKKIKKSILLFGFQGFPERAATKNAPSWWYGRMRKSYTFLLGQNLFGHP